MFTFFFIIFTEENFERKESWEGKCADRLYVVSMWSDFSIQPDGNFQLYFKDFNYFDLASHTYNALHQNPTMVVERFRLHKSTKSAQTSNK